MKLLRNILVLFVLQASIYIFPIVVTPYLTRVLGVSMFGVLGIAAGLTGYAVIVIEWGFSLSATRDIARHHEDPQRLTEIFWEVMLAKILLGMAAIIILNVIVFCVPAFQVVRLIVVFSQIQLIGTILNADWYLRGLELMGWYTIVSLVGRLSTIPLLILFVKTPDDIVWAAFIQGSAFLISSLVSLAIVARSGRVKWYRFNIQGAISRAKESSSLFLSTAGIGIYLQSSVLIVGLFAGTYDAGLFAGADRVRRGMQGLSGPISGAVYPRINKLVAQESASVRQLLLFFFVGQFLITALLSITMFAFAPTIVQVFLGDRFGDATAVIRCFAPIPVLVGISNVLGTNIMIPLGMNQEFMWITLISGLFNIVALSVLTVSFGAVGGAIACTLTEGLVTTVMCYYVFSNFSQLLNLGAVKA